MSIFQKKINVGDVFLICDQGFDFDYEIRNNSFSTTIYETSYFERNNFKYLEIIDKIKVGKRKKYKVRLFCENKEVTKNEWRACSYYQRKKELYEIYKWLYPKVIYKKLNCGAIQYYSWADIAKETLLEEVDNV